MNQAEGSIPDTTDDRHPDGSTPHIMAINDFPEMLSIYQDALEFEGYRVSIRTGMETDPNDMAELIAEMRPDAVIIDLTLGSPMVGKHVVDKIHAHPDISRLPIIVATADTTGAAIIMNEFGEDNPLVQILLKPFDLERLLDVVTAGLQTSR